MANNPITMNKYMNAPRKYAPRLSRIQAFGSLVFVCLLSFSSPVAALTDAQFRTYASGIYYFDIDAAQACGLAVNLNGNDNIQKAFNFFVGKGLTPAQSAGIVGNLMVESGVNPNSQQDRSSDLTPKNGVGFGIAQWTYPNRQDPLVAYAKQQGTTVTDLGAQLGFMWAELAGDTQYAGMPYSKALEYLKATTSAHDAAVSFMIYYEAPKDNAPDGPNAQDRAGKADEVLTANGGITSPASTSTTASDTNSCTTGNGQNTKYIDGFTIYSQYDPAWEDKPYGTTTIGEAGCGPSAMAMIITALTGTTVTPVDTANYATSQGMYTQGVGSSWDIGKVLPAHWNLKTRFIGADTAKISAALQAGELVIVAGSGPSPFTSNGHFIVIRGVTADGKWKVGDSGHTDTNTQNWDPQQLVTSMHGGSVYAISK